MTKRIFRYICLVALSVFFAAACLLIGVQYEYFTQVEQDQLKMQTSLAAQGVTNEGIAYFKNLDVKDYRISWIDSSGEVLYDSESDTAKMENHLERAEVLTALSKGYGESRRYSSTLMERSLYSAQRLADGTILRLSISQKSILTLLLAMIQPICIIFAIALILSVTLAVRVSKKLVKPLNEIDLDHPLANEGYDELSPLLRRINTQQKQLQKQRAELHQKENELNTIISSMNEGMVLLNAKGRIISINPAAKKLLDTETGCIGEDILILCRHHNLQEIVSKALSGAHENHVVKIHEASYQISANPIVSEDSVKGAALFFFNITEREQAEQIRREFTANVSHELKTPLHSISGYAELMKNDMVKENDRIPFAGKIYDEAQRLMRLVEDIINLSHLDEGTIDQSDEDVNLYELAHSVMNALETEAAAAHVKMELTGDSAVFCGINQLLYSLIYNLLDNAIKYNKENGQVLVNIKDSKTDIVLSIKDTGIGIATEHQERIFERFYRVDKSHSKQVGGTGLGLSIVKHAARIHHAKIEVKSNLGEGTEVIVSFPKQTKE